MWRLKKKQMGCKPGTVALGFEDTCPNPEARWEDARTLQHGPCLRIFLISPYYDHYAEGHPLPGYAGCRHMHALSECRRPAPPLGAADRLPVGTTGATDRLQHGIP
jgi:hypothetical protein